MGNASVNEEKVMFFKATEYYNQELYLKAIEYFEKTIQFNGEFKNWSLIKLANIYIILGRYEKARTLLSTLDKRCIDVKKLYALLENIESNYMISRDYYTECSKENNYHNLHFLYLCRSYIQTGDYAIAEQRLRALQLTKDYGMHATLMLITLKILLNRFDEADKILNTIDKNSLSDKYSEYYRNLKLYVLEHYGLLESVEAVSSKKSYNMQRFLDKDDRVLLEHIDRHKDKKYRFKYGYGAFLEDLDLANLVGEVGEAIKDMNANHCDASDRYLVRLNKPIGIIDNEDTTDVCAITMLGSKKLLTLYPVKLSNEFNKEKMNESKELRKKRIDGGLR